MPDCPVPDLLGADILMRLSTFYGPLTTPLLGHWTLADSSL